MKTNCKAVKELIREHIKDFYDPADLAEQVAYLTHTNRRECPTNYHAVRYMVQGGCFLCYYNQVNAFLDSLGINPNGNKYSDEKSWELYCHLLARDAELLIKYANS